VSAVCGALVPVLAHDQGSGWGRLSHVQRNLGCRATYVITHLDEGFVEVVAAGYCRPIVQ